MSYENSGELEFAALQADDLLLDALGARRPAGGSGDVVAGLLTAYALKVDTRTGPLTGLLTADEPYDAADYVPMPQPVATMVAPPPIDEPVDLPTHRRSKFLVAHRAAAVVTVGSLVLGLGGVSAAAGGQGSPLDGIRRVMSSVSDQVTPQQSPTERVSHTLADAEKALAAADLRSARDLLEEGPHRHRGCGRPGSVLRTARRPDRAARPLAPRLRRDRGGRPGAAGRRQDRRPAARRQAGSGRRRQGRQGRQG